MFLFWIANRFELIALMLDAWVTVIVPTRQRINYLTEALDSVRNQTFADWCCIVAVDGEDSETISYLRQIEMKDPRFSHLVVKNGGSAARARNAALALVRTSYVAFLDDDDIWLDCKLACQHDNFIEYPESVLSCGQIICFGDLDGIWPNGYVPECLDADYLCSGNKIATSTVVASTHALLAAGGFSPQYLPAEDYHLWLSLTRAGLLRHLPIPLARYRVHAGGVSQNQAAMLKAVEQLLTHHYREGLFSKRTYLARLCEIYAVRSRAAKSLFPRLLWKACTIVVRILK